MSIKTTITQQELSEATGLTQSSISEALRGIKPITLGQRSIEQYDVGRRIKQYDPKEALEAIIAYLERRRQAVLDATERKTAKLDSHIAAAKRLLEV